jgi:hypothetical protein
MPMHEVGDEGTYRKNALVKKGESLSKILLACEEVDYFD